MITETNTSHNTNPVVLGAKHKQYIYFTEYKSTNYKTKMKIINESMKAVSCPIIEWDSKLGKRYAKWPKSGHIMVPIIFE